MKQYQSLKENGDIGTMTSSRRTEDIDIKILQQRKQQAELKRYGRLLVILVPVPVFSLIGTPFGKARTLSIHSSDLIVMLSQKTKDSPVFGPGTSCIKVRCSTELAKWKFPETQAFRS